MGLGRYSRMVDSLGAKCARRMGRMGKANSMISDAEWSALCGQVKRWEKLARDQDEQTPPGDGGQRMPERRCEDGCNGCDDCTDYEA